MLRRLSTFVSAVSLVLFSAGCVYVPAADAPPREGSPDPGRLIGPDKLIRPGAVTREEAVALLGEPYSRLPNDRSVAYLFKMKAGHWVVLPLFAVVRADRLVAARLDFGPDGVLRAVRTERGGHSPMHFLGPVPPMPHMSSEFRRWPSTRTAATAATTTRAAMRPTQ